jgi:hypothetical protein
VDCCEIEHTTIIYRCLSVVVCKEKLRLDFLGSYDSVGDGHFVVIDRVRKCWKKSCFQRFPHTRASIDLGGSRDPMCVTKRSSHESDLVHTSRWGVSYSTAVDDSNKRVNSRHIMV